MEVGKIIIAGMTGVGALLLGEVIEKALNAIPGFAVEIPLLGSLANILGIFFAAVVAGIVGAIGLNLLEKRISKKRGKEVQDAKIEKGNKILDKQHQIQIINEAQLEKTTENVKLNISERHREAFSVMRDSYENIMEDFVDDFSCENSSIEKDNNVVIDSEYVSKIEEIDSISEELDDLLK